MLQLLVCIALLRSASGAADPREALVGWYELEPERRVLVTFGADGGLRLFDFDAPSFDRLEGAGERFRWLRQRDEAPAELVFERDVGERATAFAWSAGEARGRAARTSGYGYEQEEVRFASGEVELCGLLMLPVEESGAEHAPPPGAVIVHGSGDSDRDNVWAFSIANHLALSGIAVLLPDKRGAGQSRGDWKAVGFDALADDALAGLDVLARVPELDSARIGLVGLSQGGWIAPLAASRARPAPAARVAYSVSVSAAAVPVRAQVLHELEQTLRSGGADDEAVGIALELMRMAFEFGASGAGWEDYLAGVEAAPPALRAAFPSARDDWRWSWYARVIDHDPLSSLRATSVPCLLVYGEEDERDNVPVAASVARLGAWTDETRRADVTLRVYPGSGHALGDPATSWIRRDFLDELARWILACERPR